MDACGRDDKIDAASGNKSKSHAHVNSRGRKAPKDTVDVADGVQKKNETKGKEERDGKYRRRKRETSSEQNNKKDSKEEKKAREKKRPEKGQFLVKCANLGDRTMEEYRRI